MDTLTNKLAEFVDVKHKAVKPSIIVVQEVSPKNQRDDRTEGSLISLKDYNMFYANVGS